MIWKSMSSGVEVCRWFDQMLVAVSLRALIIRGVVSWIEKNCSESMLGEKKTSLVDGVEG